MTETREPTRLMIVLEAGAGAGERLVAVCQGSDVASLVLRAMPGGKLEAQMVAPLVAEAQRRGIAALVEGDAQLARTVRADGVHIPPGDRLGEAMAEVRGIAGGRAIVGADVGRSRDDAMQVGEDGADYVGFGIPAFVKERQTAIERRLDLVDWWAEIFEVPCVAFDVETAADAGELAAAGADFVAVTIGAGMSPGDARDLVQAVAAEIASAAAGSGT